MRFRSRASLRRNRFVRDVRSEELRELPLRPLHQFRRLNIANRNALRAALERLRDAALRARGRMRFDCRCCCVANRWITECRQRAYWSAASTAGRCLRKCLRYAIPVRDEVLPCFALNLRRAEDCGHHTARILTANVGRRRPIERADGELRIVELREREANLPL